MRQLKPTVLTRDWARSKRDEWEAVMETCSDLGCFHGLLEVMKRDGVDFKAAAATVKPAGAEEETASHDELLARLLESKVRGEGLRFRIEGCCIDGMTGCGELMALLLESKVGISAGNRR